jgi:hypothetical protein
MIVMAYGRRIMSLIDAAVGRIVRRRTGYRAH